jgi:hypothetical protein
MNNMNKVVKLIQSIAKEEIKMLGRWNIDYCNKKIGHKIDLSNEDHCGSCNQYRLDKLPNNVSKKVFVPDLE